MKMYQLQDNLEQGYNHICAEIRYWFWNLETGDIFIGIFICIVFSLAYVTIVLISDKIAEFFQK